MEKTLYVSDLDGTLLTPEQRLSPFTVRVLEYLLGQGVAFTYATARSGYSAAAVTQGLESPLPVILYNGAFVRLGPQGEVLLRQGFSPKQGEAVKKLLARWEIQPLVYTLLEGKERVRWVPGKETPGVARYLESRQGDPRLLPAQEASLYEGEVFYFTCIGRREELLPAWEALRREEGACALLQEEIYQPGEFWLEVMPAGATKANGARRLKEGLGCSSMVCFGDGLNDLPLLQAADHACAVANAVPELRAAADEVIPSNAQDGVAKWLLADTAPALALGERAGAFRLRLYRPEDLEELVQLFYETVHTVNLGGLHPGGDRRLGALPGGCGPGRLGGKPFRPLHRGGGAGRPAAGLWGHGQHRLFRQALRPPGLPGPGSGHGHCPRLGGLRPRPWGPAGDGARLPHGTALF